MRTAARKQEEAGRMLALPRSLVLAAALVVLCGLRGASAQSTAEEETPGDPPQEARENPAGDEAMESATEEVAGTHTPGPTELGQAAPEDPPAQESRPGLPGAAASPTVGRENPFAPLVRILTGRNSRLKPRTQAAAEEPALASVSLEGIIWASNRPQAIINGVLVDVGDAVAGRKVARIGPEEVILEARGKTERVEMPVTPLSVQGLKP